MSAFSSYQDLATPKLRAILTQLGPAQRRSLLLRLGKELEIQLKAHFAARDQEGNKRGWPRSHWWAREVRGNTALREVTADSATVGIASRQFRFKLTGGTIRPGPGKRALALPMRPEVKGVLPRAKTIPGIFVIRSKILGRAWLVTRDSGPHGALRFYWRLVPSVHQDPDVRALPPVAELQAALERRADLEVARIVEQAK